MNVPQMLLVACKYTIYVSMTFFTVLSLIGLLLGGWNLVLFLFFIIPILIIVLNYLFMDKLIQLSEEVLEE